MSEDWTRAKQFRKCIGVSLCVSLCAMAGARGQVVPLLPGVEKVCAIQFDKDRKRPARVEDSALGCLAEAVRRLKASPDRKLVLVGVKDMTLDREAANNGRMREKEDTTGYDVRLEDLAAYRSLNTKWYLTRWYHIDPARMLPATDEFRQGQDVTFYLVPGDADFNHNYLDATKTNERPCTVKPCYPADEESLAAQPRSRIPAATGRKSNR